MRRHDKQTSTDIAWDLLRQAPKAQVALLDDAGRPLLRTVHPVVLDDGVFFHSASAGQKLQGVGRPCVFSVDKLWTEVPSYAFGTEHACPATSIYDSAQASGTLQRVVDVAPKARVLQALMRQFQPEGRHRPIDGADGRYRTALQKLEVLGVVAPDVVGKSAWLQNKSAAARTKVAHALWQRGTDDDVATLRAWTRRWPKDLPHDLQAPQGLQLRLGCAPALWPQVAAFVDGQYWTQGIALHHLREAHLSASAWVGLVDAHQTLVACARATCDGRRAWVYDVIVDARRRNQGLGSWLMQTLLQHPRVRRCHQVWLGTRTAQAVYERLGFEAVTPSSTTMRLSWAEGAAAT